MKKIAKVVGFPFVFLLYFMCALDGGMGQSLPSPSVQELLAMVRQASDGETLEVLAKALERKIPVTSAEAFLLIEALDHPHWEMQRAAVVALGNGKVTDAVPNLLEKLQVIVDQSAILPADADAPRRTQDAFLAEALVAALSFIADRRALAPLLSYPAFYTSHMGAKPIAAFGAQALPDILAIAQDAQDPRRLAMMGVLANLRDRTSVDGLLEALQATDGEIRKSALSALRALRTREAIPLFETLLADSDGDTRQLALSALVEMQPEKYSTTALLFLQDRSALVRGQVADLLARLKRVEAVPALEKLLADPNDAVRYRAAQALEKLTGNVYTYKRTKMVRLFEELVQTSAGQN